MGDQQRHEPGRDQASGDDLECLIGADAGDVCESA
jgi:hypothetical protein